MIDITDLTIWKDDSAVYWEKKPLGREALEREDEFNLAMLSLVYLWNS